MSEVIQQGPLLDDELQEKPKNGEERFGAGSIFLLASIVLAAVIFGLALARQNQVQPKTGPALGFEFTTFEGESYHLADFRGKVIVLNFWASWCAPCRHEAPELQSAWEKYQNQDVIFIGIAYADNGPRSEAYLEEFDITYLNAPDLGTRISDAYNIHGVPETFIIDQDGNVAQFIYAGVTEHQLSQLIDPLLVEGN